VQEDLSERQVRTAYLCLHEQSLCKKVGQTLRAASYSRMLPWAVLGLLPATLKVLCVVWLWNPRFCSAATTRCMTTLMRRAYRSWMACFRSAR
jgi:hypothetical protein